MRQFALCRVGDTLKEVGFFQVVDEVSEPLQGATNKICKTDDLRPSCVTLGTSCDDEAALVETTGNRTRFLLSP